MEGNKKGAQERGVSRFEQLERFSETAGDEELIERIKPLVDEWGINRGIREEVACGSEDFGHFSKFVSSICFILGLGENVPPVHNVNFEFQDAAIPYGLEFFQKIARHGL